MEKNKGKNKIIKGYPISIDRVESLIKLQFGFDKIVKFMEFSVGCCEVLQLENEIGFQTNGYITKLDIVRDDKEHKGYMLIKLLGDSVDKFNLGEITVVRKND